MDVLWEGRGGLNENVQTTLLGRKSICLSPLTKPIAQAVNQVGIISEEVINEIPPDFMAKLYIHTFMRTKLLLLNTTRRSLVLVGFSFKTFLIIHHFD